MPIEQLTYANLAERLAISSEAARAIVKRHRLPRSRSNDGKTLVSVDPGRALCRGKRTGGPPAAPKTQSGLKTRPAPSKLDSSLRLPTQHDHKIRAFAGLGA